MNFGDTHQSMTLVYGAYTLLTSGLFLTLFPPFWIYTRIAGKYGEGMSHRLGHYPREIIENISGSPRIWIHAASVGEVRVAEAIVESLTSLMPDCAVILSTVTRHGQACAREALRSRATCLYAPLDFIGSARKALRTLRPDALVCLETEIWPNWLISAHRMGIRTAIVNGRISVRSVGAYIKIQSLMKETLKHIDALSMISTQDAERVIRVGADPQKVHVNGNAKYDLLFRQLDPSIQRKTAQMYRLTGKEPVLVAGSTRGREDEIVVDAFRKILPYFPETLLIIAPRHIDKSLKVKEMVLSRGLSCQLRTGLGKGGCRRTASVVILDTIGELQFTYSVASVVFCGGSLVPAGGQNLLEPAVWGKPVLYGPSTEDFVDAKKLLDVYGGGIQVSDGEDLAKRMIDLLHHPDEAVRIGALAKKAVMSHRGAAKKHAAVICNLFQDRG